MEMRIDGKAMMPEQSDEKKTLALDYDPNREKLLRRHDVTAPLNPDNLPAPTATRSPMVLFVAALLIIVVIAAAVLLSLTIGDSSDSMLTEDTNPASAACLITSPKAVNVRAGPDFAYERIWILEAQQSRQVFAQAEANTWWRLANGWVPQAEVSPSDAEVCQALPAVESYELFLDTLTLPADIQALGWQAILGETFATDANAWLASSQNIALQEGALTLFGDSDTLAYAQRLDISPTDVYYGFRLNWVASGVDAVAVFRFHQQDDAAYQVALMRTGRLVLSRVDGDNTVILGARRQAVMLDTFEVGVWRLADEVVIFVDGEVVLRDVDTTLNSGDYGFGVYGQNATVQIQRFDVRISR